MVKEKTKVGKYSITSMIAKGGMGKIYKAKHPTLHRDIILKRLTLVGNRMITERFKREAQLMIDFREDRIVQVYDHFKEGASYYIVMEYVDGISLAELIDKNRYLPDDFALMIFYEICKALKYAHDKGVIHRDIKPENILISKDGAVKLTDFGIATSKDCQDECLTKNMTLGTPAYMSPEQINDSSTVDNRADIYSMGVLLYKMITGKCPYPGNMTPETINLITKGKYKLPRKINPKISTFTQRIIQKAMHKSLKKRYYDLDEIIFKLESRTRKLKNSETIKGLLKDYIYGNKSNPKSSVKQTIKMAKRNLFIPKNKRTKLIAKIAGAGMLFIVLLIYIFSNNYHYELLHTKKYGAFDISVTSNKRFMGSIRYIEAYIQKKQKHHYKHIKDSYFSFTKKTDSKNLHAITFNTKRHYAKTGQYRIIVIVNNSKYQKDFFLKPRSVQRYEKDFNTIQHVIFKHNLHKTLPVLFKLTVRDSITGEHITSQSKIKLYLFNKWITYKEYQQKESIRKHFITGRTYSLLFTAKNYLSKYVHIPIKLYQSQVSITVDIEPIPGILSIKSNKPGPKLTINNRSHYVQGGYYKQVKEVKTLNKKYQHFILAPGNYYVTCKWKGNKKIAKVTVQPKKYTWLNVTLHKKSKMLQYTTF